MNREPLKNGTVLCFPDGQECEVVRLLGAGGCALLYEVKILGSELYAAVKEVFPARGYIRKDGQILPQRRLPQKEKELQRRKDALIEQETLLSQKASRKNHHVLFLQPPVWNRADLRLPDATVFPNVENTYARMDSLAEKGAPLAQLVPAGGFPLDDALSVMETVLDAYAALHEDGFLHGDCQLSNLFLLKAGRDAQGAGTACIIDFGSARELGADGLTSPITDEIFSTDGYCAPELMFPRGEDLRLSAAADVWSLGFLLLNLLTDRGLEEIDGITEFLMFHPEEKVLTCAEAAALGCTPAQEHLLRAILNRALADDPDLRYPDAGTMREDLRKLIRCRKSDTANGLNPYLLWDAAWRHYQANPSLFQTEHQPRLAKHLPTLHLTVQARLENGSTAPVDQLLTALAQTGDNVYLYAAGGAGKSFAAAPLFAHWMKHGDLRIPLYLDLAHYTAEKLEQCGGDCCRVLPDLLTGQYFGCADSWEQVDALLRNTPCFLVLDNLHKADHTVLHTAIAALNQLQQNYPDLWALVLGRAEDPGALQGQALPCPTLNMQRVQLLPFSAEEIVQQVKRVQNDVLAAAQRAALQQQKTTLGLPLFLTRYLELISVADTETGFLPDSTMELLHGYFGRREYEANDRSVHELINEHLPWIAYQYEQSEQPLHTADEIVHWLQERYSWGLDSSLFFHQSVDNLAILEPNGNGEYRFVHDCYQEYFAALFAANCIQQAVSRQSAQPLKPVSHLWQPDLTAHCIDLCCLEQKRGQVVWTRTVHETLDLLYRVFSGLRRAETMQLSKVFMNLYALELHSLLTPERVERWLALASLGNPLLRGFGLFARLSKLHDRSATTSLYLRTKGLFNESGQAQYQLAQLYAGGTRVRKSYKKARRYLESARDKGYPPALNDWGEILEKAGSYDHAVQMYQKAAEQHHPRAMWHMGQAHLQGQGTAQDAALAFRFFERGAEYGDILSQYSLAQLLESGVGCTRDAQKALFWYEKAAALGSDQAKEAAEKLRATLTN